MATTWQQFRKVIQRKRVFEPDQLEDSGLKRCLTSWDLAGLGLGSTLGVGVYVLVGSVALRVAGPSIVLSFLIAAVASMFAGLCYAELGSRVPRSGSAYIYTYVSVGEFAAFLIGWNMILEGLFGTASVARGLSCYIDSMSYGTLSNWFLTNLPLGAGHHFSPYFDLLACLIVLVLGVLLAVGARESSMVNNVLALINMAVIIFIVFAGAFTAKSYNWSIPASDVPANYGVGGFFPYGTWGTFQGAALCFYGFIGFDVISATGEEVHEPRRAIPHAILVVLCIVFVVYASVATVVTMMVPYYALDKVAAVATAFSYVNWEWARWMVSIGACFGISASLFGSMYPLPRLLYSMASDGLMLPCFGYVCAGRKTPLVATLIPALVISILTAVVELDQLILMMCIGTLLSYTFVSACVVLLRYGSKVKPEESASYLKQMLGCGDRTTPSQVSSRIVIAMLFLFVCTCVATALVGSRMQEPLIPVAALHGLGLILLIIITLQPQVKEELAFKTPLVPVIPCLSIYVNIHLMILVNLDTWIRVIIWMLIGIPFYALFLCCYKRRLTPDAKLKETDQNGKTPVQIVVEAPTPPGTVSRDTAHAMTEHIKNLNNEVRIADTTENTVKQPIPIFDEIIVQEVYIEYNEEKEAKIIDLLDQVLQAEEDSYVEEISDSEKDTAEPEQVIMVPLETSEQTGAIPHRKSFSELSDAGSETSLTNQDTKYSVIAQVHREDLPKLNEEEEKIELEDMKYNIHESINDTTNETTNGKVTENEYDDDSETLSRTDESGYSDTLDRYAFNDSIEDNTKELYRIPTPPPLDEMFLNSSFLYIKSYSMPARQLKLKAAEFEVNEDEKLPRVSVLSNASGQSQDDGTIVFGSSRQMRFMNKLNDIFQNKIATDETVGTGDEQRKRSNSTGDVTGTEQKPELIRDRPTLFLDMKKELLAMHSVPNLRPIDKEVENKREVSTDIDDITEDSSMSREDLKSKLETIFATGGPKLLKPRLMKSNPPTPEESYQTDISSTESIAKVPKVEKNDTLKRQKDKFGAVLNSFMLSLKKEDAV